MIEEKAEKSLINTHTDIEKSISIPEINSLPDQAKAEVASKLIELQNQREQREVELLKLQLEYNEHDKQRIFEAEQKQRDREEREAANFDAKEERREERDFKATENERNREHDSSEKSKDRETETANNIRNNRSAIVSAINFKNIAIAFCILLAMVVGIRIVLNQSGKVYAPDKSFKNEDVDVVYNRFIAAGFTNIKKTPNFDSTNAKDDNMVKTVYIKGRDDFKETDKFDPGDSVEIIYYMVGRGYSPYSSAEVVGLQVDVVEGKFIAAGFTNTKTEPVTISDGSMGKNNKVISVTINKCEDYSRTTIFDKDSNVTIKYYAFSESKVPDTNKGFKNEKYNDVEAKLKEAGFVNITCNAVCDERARSKGKVISVEIDGKLEYKKNDSFRQDVPIVISYYDLPENIAIAKNQARILLSAKDIIGKDYKEIEQELRDFGFTNIKLIPVEDGSEGFINIGNNINKIISIKISGNTDFEKYQVFDKDSIIEIEYHEKKPD